MRRSIGIFLFFGFVFSFVSMSAAADSHGGDNADPLQNMNRKVFAFDMGVDRWVVEPTSRGWNHISNLTMRESVNKFFVNLRFPRRFVSKLLQGEVVEGGKELARFVVNTTVGVFGFFDPATDLGLPLKRADFGQTFGVWGIGSGPYLVLPFFGPSNPRDTVGLIFDSVVSFSSLYPIGYFLTPFDMVNYRSLHAQDISDAQAASLDYYVFVRNAYNQQRYALIHHEASAEGTGAFRAREELYNVDDEDD